MKKLLKSKKINSTAFRIAVLNVFLENDNALSTHEIEESLQGYDRITLYRTIKVFQEKGLIHPISIAGESVKYGLCKETCSEEKHAHNHVHFKCSICSKVFCEETSKFPTINLPGFQIQSLELNAVGICPSCN